jgi:DNA-directed RNA polymerase specialized sigma24 family protein
MQLDPEKDRELVRACTRGERSAWAELIQTYYAPMLAFALTQTTDAAAADAAVRKSFETVFRCHFRNYERSDEMGWRIWNLLKANTRSALNPRRQNLSA